MTRPLFALSAILFALTGATASSQPLTNFGMRTCANWNTSQQAPTSPDTIAVDNWVFGRLDGLAKYVDATNATKGLPPQDILSGLDRPSALALVNQYCVGRLARTLDQALGAMSAQMVASNRQIIQARR